MKLDIYFRNLFSIETFRHTRFRPSKAVMVNLVALVREYLPFIGEPDCAGRSGSPIDLLVIGSLVILGDHR